ncbi:MAG: hypothetical protein ACP5HQ_06330 [Thermoprotei archaeon]
MIALVSDYGITIADVADQPVHSDGVLVSPITLAFNGIENAVYLGLIWARPKTILGSMGVVKVVETGVDVDPNVKGKKFVVSPFSRSRGGLGSDVNGIAAELASIPQDALMPYVEELGDVSVLAPFLSIAVKVNEVADGKRLLVLGGGPLGSITAEACEDCDSVGVYSESYRPKSPKVKVVNRLEPSSWDVVFIATLESWAADVAARFKTAVLPRLTLQFPPVPIPNAIEIVPYYSDSVPKLARSLGLKHLSELLVKSDSLEAAIPTVKGKIVVVEAEKIFKKRLP